MVEKLRILMIESDEYFQRIYRRKLQRYRTLFTFTGSLRDSHKQVANIHYDVIFLGDTLRDSDGPTAYDRLREAGYEGPIIILTSDRGLDRSKYNGIAATMYKTFSKDEIISVVKSLVNETQQRYVELSSYN